MPLGLGKNHLCLLVIAVVCRLILEGDPIERARQCPITCEPFGNDLPGEVIEESEVFWVLSELSVLCSIREAV